MSTQQHRTKLLVLSPNEQAAAVHRDELERRRRRLQQVREQERRVSALRRNQFQSELAKQMTVAADKLTTDFEVERQERMAQLRTVLDHAQADVGASYRAAELVAEEQERELLELDAQVRRDQQAEKARTADAADFIHADKENRTAHYRSAIERLFQMRVAEQERARQLARWHAETHAGDIDPLAAQPSLTMQQRNLQRRLAAGDRAHRYDETFYHRDYNVVRADPESAEAATSSNAMRAADAVSERHAEFRRKLEHERQLRAAEAQQRFGHAYHDIRMEHAKDALCLQLEELRVEDRKRRQALIEPRHGIEAMPREASERQSYLRQFFEKDFTALKEDLITNKVKTLDYYDDDEEESGETGAHGWTVRSSSPRRALHMFDK